MRWNEVSDGLVEDIEARMADGCRGVEDRGGRRMRQQQHTQPEYVNTHTTHILKIKFKSVSFPKPCISHFPQIALNVQLLGFFWAICEWWKEVVNTTHDILYCVSAWLPCDFDLVQFSLSFSCSQASCGCKVYTRLIRDFSKKAESEKTATFWFGILTMSWKALKCSTELRGIAELDDNCGLI